jgi:hypothetical protein
MDFFLLDTNFFREATKSPGNRLLAALIPQLRAGGLEFGLGNPTAIRLSPFALLEALGVVPTMPPKPVVNFTHKNPNEVYRQIFDYACNYFLGLPELKDAYLRQKQKEQAAYIIPEALDLFNVCVTGILDRDLDINSVFATFLALDYFFKYPFTRDIFISMGAFLGAAFFSDVPEQSPVSRFRVSMRMYDLLRSNLQAFPGSEKYAAAFKVQSERDLLDTDIIQDVTFGFPYGGERHRVVALTFDNAKIVEARALWHRQVGFSMAKKCTGADFIRQVVNPFLSHPGGIVIQTDASGAIVDAIDLSSRFAGLTGDDS